jgi:hypothetical protein
MRVNYTFIVSLFLRPWSFMDFRTWSLSVDIVFVGAPLYIGPHGFFMRL